MSIRGGSAVGRSVSFCASGAGRRVRPAATKSSTTCATALIASELQARLRGVETNGFNKQPFLLGG
jgi:hypothetical protein